MTENWSAEKKKNVTVAKSSHSDEKSEITTNVASDHHVKCSYSARSASAQNPACASTVHTIGAYIE